MITLFTFGYHGWGNATPELVAAVDAVETNRGFEPPMFVDIRLRRSVRARGFQGNAFEKLLGPARHRWMNTLGNPYVATHTGPRIQVAEPSAVNELLDLALEAARRRQRLLFFCSCQWPRCNGQIACHRTLVAELALKAAKKRGDAIELAEWPGGKPGHINLEAEPKIFDSIGKGRTTVPLGKSPDLAEVGGLPWGSVATLQSEGVKLHRVVGRAIRQPDQWVLPILGPAEGAANELADCRKEADRLRRDLGLLAQHA